MEKYIEIFIPGNVPSSKNNKQMIFRGKTSPSLLWSKTAQKYAKITKEYWEFYQEHFRRDCIGKEFPLKVSFKFIRGSKHKFDYVNPLQTVLDLMVKHEWIPDDNADIILPIFESYEYNKENPGVLITIKT